MLEAFLQSILEGCYMKNPTEEIDRVQNQMYADHLEKKEQEINLALNIVLSMRRNSMGPDKSKYSTVLAALKILVFILILVLTILYGPK
jgi:hypothetical protein